MLPFLFLVVNEIRITFAGMKVIIEKRKPRSYKCTDFVYDRAMKVAKKKKTTLAEEVETFVLNLSNTKISTPQSNEASKPALSKTK
jgi:hypothetical protein